MATALDSEASQKLAKVIGSQDRSSINKQYNEWAQTYEKDMALVQYFGPKKLMEFFDKLEVPKEANILDFGAGTGGLGRELAKLGYTELHAVDGAKEMLARAQAEGNYKTYTHLLFEPGTSLPFADNQFDCCLMAGVFAPGHLPIIALEEVVRVVKKGGVVAWICCDPLHYQDKDDQYADNGFYKLLESIKNKGQWKERPGFPVSVPYIEYSDGYVMAFDITKQ